MAGRKVLRVATAREQSEGVGARVRRSIGALVSQKEADPFLMLDHFKVSLPAGFPQHPHRAFIDDPLGKTHSHICYQALQRASGMKTLKIKPGGMQWMSAARGILHSEIPASKDEPSIGLQLWINLPKEEKLAHPEYQEYDAEQLSRSEKDGVKAIVIAGSALGATSPVRTRTPTHYIHFVMQPGATLAQHPIPEGWTGIVYAIDGAASFGANEDVVKQYDTAVLSKEEGEKTLTVTAQQSGCEFILISGQPLNEPIAQQGPFVMNTQDELRQAFMDFQTASNGFEKARTFSPTIDKMTEV